MAELDDHVVAPARLKLMTMLTAVSQAEFSTNRDALDVSDSVLSKHLTALDEVGYKTLALDVVLERGLLDAV